MRVINEYASQMERSELRIRQIETLATIGCKICNKDTFQKRYSKILLVVQNFNIALKKAV